MQLFSLFAEPVTTSLLSRLCALVGLFPEPTSRPSDFSISRTAIYLNVSSTSPFTLPPFSSSPLLLL
ncbi:hypothetical protein ACRALDRAFT_1064152 [Sodiomyces alcalophilus JCM 7366]|uniref:uncharacterized protein n=1 Tax=Sodiomyces alcalophilus JCM 7366 TaxID=591952 RepID=UPI0039B386CE